MMASSLRENRDWDGILICYLCWITMRFSQQPHERDIDVSKSRLENAPGKRELDEFISPDEVHHVQ